MENPEKAAGAAAAAGAVLGGANKLMRSVNGNIVRRRELHDKKLRVYDPSLKAFVYLKKPLDNKDTKRIYAKKAQTGKRICEILAEEGMLRK